jgi:hypothetical protein
MLAIAITPAAAFFQRQTGLRTVQGLDLALLVAAQHNGVLGRREIEAHDVVELLNEMLVVG